MFTEPTTENATRSTLAASMGSTLSAPFALHSTVSRPKLFWTLIADMLQAIAEYSKNDRAEFIRTVQETQAAQQTADISKKRKRLAAAQKRAGELEKLICKIYEDNALGKLPDAR